MAVTYWERFSSRMKTVDDSREPFRSVLQRELRGEESTWLLIYTPPSETSRARSPASVLVLTDNGWLFVTEAEDGNATARRSDFAHTLLVELTVILLYGALRIDFAADGRAQSIAIEFNTVMEQLYEEAAQLLLDGVDGVARAVPVDRQAELLLLRPLPLKFCNAALEFTPQGEHLLALEDWPAVFGGKRRWFQRELAPEAILALTERELMLISDEKTWSWLRIGRISKYGNIVTHCPLARLGGFQLCERGPLALLELAVHAGTTGEAVQVAFPAEQKTAVSEIVLRAFQQKDAPHVAAG